jgi:hypothetical protein
MMYGAGPVMRVVAKQATNRVSTLSYLMVS